MCKDFALISISVDPEFDRPDVFKAWGERYGVGAGWSMVTGPKVEVDHLLKKLGTFAADRENHQSQVLILDGATGRGLRTSGLAAPADLVKVLRGVRALRPGTGSRQALSERNADAAAQRYFSDTILVDQSGRRHCFHADLLRGKVVVINVFFSACNGSCVAMANTLAALQKKLGDRLERDVRLISISVDSRNDSPAVLSTYAQRTRHAPAGTS